jgi:hypothetical protein
MKGKLKKAVFVLFLFLLIGTFGYNYILRGGGRNIQSEESVYRVSSNEIKNEFSNNIDVATKKYLNKTIEISGSISGVKDSVVTIDETIFCKMKSFENISENQLATIKGRFVGFDDLMNELKLDECSISIN